MGCPVFVDSVDGEELVDFVIRLSSLVERHGSTAHDKEDATKSEEVDSISLVGLSVKNFWCHVSKSASEGPLESRAISALKRSGETKVDHFAIEVVVENDVLWL